MWPCLVLDKFGISKVGYGRFCRTWLDELVFSGHLWPKTVSHKSSSPSLVYLVCSSPKHLRNILAWSNFFFVCMFFYFVEFIFKFLRLRKPSDWFAYLDLSHFLLFCKVTPKYLAELTFTDIWLWSL